MEDKKPKKKGFRKHPKYQTEGRYEIHSMFCARIFPADVMHVVFRNLYVQVKAGPRFTSLGSLRGC